MGGDHEYGRGDASGDGSRSYGGGRRGYGSQPGEGENPASGADQGGADRGYGGSAPRGYGDPGQGDRGYGASGGSRGYGQDSGSDRGYGGAGGGSGDSRGYGQPSVDPQAGGHRGSSHRARGQQGPIPGEIVYGGAGVPGGTRQMPSFPDQPTRAGEDAPGGPGRRSRIEERRAARSGAEGTPEYAPGQGRSDRYGPSAIDGRGTRNGAGRRAAERAAGRPVKKTGYHRYFDYPRTGMAGWRQFVPSIKQVSSFMLAGFFLLIGLVAYEYATVQIPTAESLASTAQVTNFTYDDGSTTFATMGSKNRQTVNISQIPPVMQNAIIAAEDKTFRTNPGISYTGMIRSFINDVEGKPLQGGSTLTQQFVKNAYLTQNQTFSRKMDEIFIALKIGHTWTKDRVMQEYLNTVFFGRNSYGVEAASKAWLGKDISQITSPSDAAFLASLVNEPTNFSKGWDSTEDPATQQYWQGQLKTRWGAVLQNMQSYGLISQADYTAAAAKFPAVVTQASTTETAEQQQMQQAVKNWIDSYAAANPNSNIPSLSDIESGSGGYTIVTTFNQKYMALAKQAVQDQLLSKLNNKDWYDQNLYPALAAVDPTTGELVAFYGGTTQYNWATQGQVQPGSTFKAFTLATAFKQNISPDSYISGDSPWPKPGDTTEQQQAAGDPPVKNDDGSHGMITINTATAASVNTAFVRLSNQVTYKDVMQTINDLGINSKNAQGLADNARLTLGISAVSPARMASAYSAFADNGAQYPLIEVKEIKNSDGSTDWKPNARPTQALDPNVAETVTQTLTHVTQDKDGTAYGASDQTGLQNIAGKTGTSTMDMNTLQQKYPDIYDKTQNGYFTTAAVWFNGYTPKLEAAVAVSRWINEKGTMIQAPVDNINGSGFSFGASVSLPIWSEFMKLMQGTNSKFTGDPAFPAPNTSTMQIQNSPSASPSASASPTKSSGKGHGGPGGPSGTATPTESSSPTPSSTCTPQFLFGGCQGGGGGGGGTPTPSASGVSGSPTAIRKH
ncbi:MAG TPA: transglycosylase domain-containing protein [Actinocrinis sp.]|uniref:transglycosylase domain-containing protein n=1 Tax=Actinocrinis sp. TaxID=1920516 RepID=UPI002DDCAD2B|nr:transglycosylase domain-containing protein [Actinocrinis sp.]HEV2345612.1 transglycosylase domain-containing protein [Actinocrinis sp.]